MRFFLPVLFFTFLFTGPALAASPFQTKEYYYTNASAYDAINLSKAYELGFTGKGVVLGMIDESAQAYHPELQGKVLGRFVPDGLVINWEKHTHGTHVGGSMVAKKNGVGMHGVAYDANLVSSAMFFGEASDTSYSATVSYFFQYPQVRIINNSWGFSSSIENDPTYSFLESIPKTTKAYYDLAMQDRVMVFSAGNSGWNSPDIMSAIPLKYPELMGNFVTVIALNSAKPTSSIALPALFSNLAMDGAQDYAVSSPGIDIVSAFSGKRGGYTSMSGTSMAAPITSGVLGLVEQAFPYMGAKQLTSTMLSTANKFEPAPYTAVIKEITDSDTETLKINLLYFEGAIQSNDQTADLTDYYNENSDLIDEFYQINTLEGFLALDVETTTVSFADVFGHGYLNAGKAVQGPGYFKASWLNPNTDIRPVAVNGDAKEWQYTVDTKGYSSIWSNDITEITYGDTYGDIPGTSIPIGLPTEYNDSQLAYYGFANAADAIAKLSALPIGLTKKGQGILYLTGNNSYSGFTIIEGGAISLSTGSDPQGSIENAWVLPAGTLMGNGTVANVLHNNGTVAPGNSIGALAVQDYTQYANGVLRMEFDKAGLADQLHIAGAASLDGTLLLEPLSGYWQNNTSITLQNPLLTFGGVSTGTLDLYTHFSPTLSLAATLAPDYSGTLSLSRAPQAYSQYASNSNMRNLGDALYGMSGNASGDTQNLFQALDFSATNGSLVNKALKALSPTVYHGVAQASLDYARIHSATLLATMQSHTQGQGMSGANSGSTGLFSNSYATVIPMGGGLFQKGQKGASCATTAFGGMLGAWNFSFPKALAGISLGYTHRQTTELHIAKSQVDALSLGVQALAQDFYPLGGGSVWLYGSAALGLENTRTSRSIALNTFIRQNTSDFTAFTASAEFRLGWEHQLDFVSAGPFVGLSYGGNFRPAFTEHGDVATALHIAGAGTHSLRSSLGLQARLTGNLTEKVRVQGILSAAWGHEFLQAGSFRANFVGYNVPFTTKNIRGRDSLLLQGSANFTHADSRLTFSLFGGIEAFRAQYTGLNGGFTLGWRW